jgi:hypothetical protein
MERKEDNPLKRQSGSLPTGINFKLKRVHSTQDVLSISGYVCKLLALNENGVTMSVYKVNNKN